MAQVVYELDSLGGHDFEAVAVELFRRLGFTVQRGKQSNDQGRDLILHKDGEVTVVECKHQKGSVGRPVVQKLHSATVTWPGATRGLVVTTARFSEGAMEYAAEVNARNEVGIDLWDHDRLVEEARRVGVFLVTAKQGTSMFFEVPWSSDEAFLDALWGRHFDRLRSNPRAVREAVKVQAADLDVIPAIVVDYRVDQLFETQAGVLYHPQEKGRVIFPLETTLTRDEEEFWLASSTQHVEEGDNVVRRVAPRFGVPLAPYRDRVARDVANRLSTTVRYTGANNQSYSKHCQIRPDQVETVSQQVLLARRRVSFRIGPKAYRATMADDAQRAWIVSSTEGFGRGPNGFLQGDGTVCNDCGFLCHRESSVACADCRRTLCTTHGWRWPASALASGHPPLCSTCYKARDSAPDHLEPQESAIGTPWKATLLGLVPGLPFFMERRWVPGASLALLPVALVASQHPTSEAAGIMASLGMGISAASSALWSWRVKTHRENLRALESYAPEWRS